MRYLAVVVLGVLLGYALGGWTPRADMRRLKSQVREMEREGRRKGVGDASLAGITRMLNVPAVGEVRSAGPQSPPPGPEGEDAAAVDASVTNDAPSAMPEDPDAPRMPERWDEMTPEQRMEEAVELWRLRSDLARNSFLSNTGADEAETVRFDVLVEAMNVRIETSMTEWADLLVSEEIAPPEAAVRMMHDISGAIALTYDEFDRNMPETWRDHAGGEFQMFDLIDPRVATPLMGLEDKFDFE